MAAVSFLLQPFRSDSFSPLFQVSGTIARTKTNLHISYELRGTLSEIFWSWPRPNAVPGRKHNLWQNTCFEFFLAKPGAPQYWEANLSPSGDWNLYAFPEYRAGMHEESRVTALPFTFQKQRDCCHLAIYFPLAQLLDLEQALEIGISMVLRGKNGQQAFYALKHCNDRPDFHQRETFLIKV